MWPQKCIVNYHDESFKELVVSVMSDRRHARFSLQTASGSLSMPLGLCTLHSFLVNSKPRCCNRHIDINVSPSFSKNESNLRRSLHRCLQVGWKVVDISCL